VENGHFDGRLDKAASLEKTCFNSLIVKIVIEPPRLYDFDTTSITKKFAMAKRRKYNFKQ